MTSCKACGALIRSAARGRPREFCDGRCKGRFHRFGPDAPRACGACGVVMSGRRRKFCTTSCKNAHHNAKQDHHLRLYGIPRADVVRMAAERGGCAVCGGGGTDWVVDHDHACCPGKQTCGKCIRGVLCRTCNGGLGMFSDDPDLLLAASMYLLRGQDVLTAKPVRAIS